MISLPFPARAAAKGSFAPRALAWLATIVVPHAIAAEDVVQAGSQGVIEEIVVTADFREADLQLVPASVSVVGAEALRRRSAQHVDQVLNMTPNVNFAAGASRGRFVQIRGVGERSQFKDPLDPSVGLIVDGVDLSGIGLAGTLFDVEQVEVLRGPQGTRYGSSAMGGLVLLKSHAPTESFEGKISSGAGNYGRWHVGGVLSGPLADGVAGRLSVHQFRGDGYIDNDFFEVDDTNDFDELTLRGKLRWQLADDTVVDVSVLHIDADNGYDAFSLENTRRTGSDEPGHDRQETTAVSIAVQHDGIEAFAVQANAFWEQSDLEYGFDWDWSNIGVVGWLGGENNARDRDSFGVDLRLLSREAGPWSWVVGGYLYQRDVRLDYSDRIAFCEGCEFVSTFNSDFETKRLAGYGQVALQLSDRLRVSVGGRVESYDDAYLDSAGVVADPDDTLWGARVAIEYLAHDDVLLYGTFSRGYKTGGVNGQAVAAADPSVDPDIADFLNDRLAFQSEDLAELRGGREGPVFRRRVAGQPIRIFHGARRHAGQRLGAVPACQLALLHRQCRQRRELGRGVGAGLAAHRSAEHHRGRWDSRIGAWRAGGAGRRDRRGIGAERARTSPRTRLPAFRGGRLRHHAALLRERAARGEGRVLFSNSHNIKSGAHELVHLAAGYRGEAFDVTLWGRNLFDVDYDTRGFLLW